MPTERPLTPRQHVILRSIARGASNKEIASSLGISEQGVKAHISRLLERYGAQNRVELVALTGAWSDADAPEYAMLADRVSGLRADLRRSNAASSTVGQLRSARHADVRLAVASSAREDLQRAVSSLRELLAEVDVAVKLARELPPEAATGPLVDAIRARVHAALDQSEWVATLIAREQETAHKDAS